MKTLKKVLAMTLAFATAMTMFVSASASFTDSSDITQTEAVDTLVALGIIKGNSDGSFAPNSTVTRGEMAKMIYVLRTGSDDGATAYSGLSTKFTDIGSTWAAPYIKYCTSMGIISGRSATTFDPDATVTGMEAAKMLLVCVGYDATKAGLTGSSWSLNTAALGSDNGLFEDVDQSLSVALSRQYAAQTIFNAIDADTVTYDSNDNVQKKETTKDVTEKVATYGQDGQVNGYTTVVKSQTDNETVGEKYLDLEKTVGILRASGNAYLGDSNSSYADDDALYVVSDGNSVDEGSENEFTKVSTDYSDLLGSRVKVLYKKDNTDEVYGVYAMDENKIDTTTVASELDTVSGEQKIKIGDTKYKIDDDCEFYINNELVGSYTSNSELATFIDNNNDNNGKVIAISNDDNEKIDVLRLYTKEFAQVTSVTSKGIYVGNADCDAKSYTTPSYTTTSSYPTKFLFDDDNVEYYDDIASDDYVFVDYDYYSDKYVITKADEVTGDITAYTSSKVTINGTAYNYAANTDFADPSLGDEYTIYVDGTYAYAVDGDTAASIDSALITSIDNSYSTLSKGYKAVLLFDDNTTKDVVINEYNGTAVSSATTSAQLTAAGITEGALVEYDTSSSKYQVTKINTGYTGHKYTAIDKTNAATTYDDDDETIAGYEISDDAIIYVGYYKNDTDKDNLDMSYKAVSGSAFSNYSETKVKAADSSLFLTKESSNVDYVQLGVCIMKSKLASTGDTVYGYVTETPSNVKDSDDNTVTQLTLWNGSKSTTLTCDDKYSVAKGSFVSYEVVDDIATNVEVLNNAYYVAISGYNKSSGRLSFFNTLESSGLNYCKVVDDTQEIFFNQDDVEGEESGTIGQQATKEVTGQYTYNAVIIPDADNDDEIAAIFTEVNNSLDGDVMTLDNKALSLEVNGTKDLDIIATEELSGTEANWTSSNEGVATVDSDGKVTASAEGTTTITAKIGSYTATCEVTVTAS